MQHLAGTLTPLHDDKQYQPWVTSNSVYSNLQPMIVLRQHVESTDLYSLRLHP